MPHLDPTVLGARADVAWERKRLWYPLHVDVWNLCAPGLSPYATGAGTPEQSGMPYGSQGQPRAQILYDSTLAGAIEDHANEITHAMFPPGRDWGDMEPGVMLGGSPEDAKDETQIQRDLEKTKERIYAEIHASNFQLAASMFIFDGCVSGTG